MTINNRYREIFKLRKTKDNVPPPNTPPYRISDRESDLFMPYYGSDRLDLISNRIYGSPNYWWVILAANNYQIEFDIESGEIIRIPYPLNSVLEEIRGQV